MITKDKVKGFVMGAVSTSLILAATSAVFAEPVSKQITAVYNGVKLVVNGSQVTPRDSDNNIVEPFISEGSTYLPVRAVAQALGQAVDYDSKTSTVYIGKKPEGSRSSLTETNYVRTNGASDIKINSWYGGKQFSIANKTYNSGIAYGYTPNYADSTGTGAYVIYNLDSQYKHLTGIFGLDDQSKDSGDQGDILIIYGDGKEIYRTNKTLAGDTVKVDVDVTGVNQIKILFSGLVRNPVFADPQLSN
jgi:hypothetical protein